MLVADFAVLHREPLRAASTQAYDSSSLTEKQSATGSCCFLFSVPTLLLSSLCVSAFTFLLSHKTSSFMFYVSKL